jgi:hypothetical protein
MDWSVDTLFGLEGQAFEDERKRIIYGYLEKLPEEERHRAEILQLNLDLKRGQMGPEEFTKWIFHELTESLENLGDQMVALVHTLNPR